MREPTANLYLMTTNDFHKLVGIIPSLQEAMENFGRTAVAGQCSEGSTETDPIPVTHHQLTADLLRDSIHRIKVIVMLTGAFERNAFKRAGITAINIVAYVATNGMMVDAGEWIGLLAIVSALHAIAMKYPGQYTIRRKGDYQILCNKLIKYTIDAFSHTKIGYQSNGYPISTGDWTRFLERLVEVGLRRPSEDGITLHQKRDFITESIVYLIRTYGRKDATQEVMQTLRDGALSGLPKDALSVSDELRRLYELNQNCLKQSLVEELVGLKLRGSVWRAGISEDNAWLVMRFDDD